MPIQPTFMNAARPAQSTDRPLLQAVRRGLLGRCPGCGIGAIYGGYLKVNQRCPACREELHHHRADDAPPYFVILIVGHLVVGGALALEVAMAPPLWLQMVAWPLLAIALSLVLLPPVKSALIGLQWALRMHGFEATSVKPGHAR